MKYVLNKHLELNAENILSHPLYFLGFLTFHGLIFLGGGYFISFTDPGFAIMHSGLGILVYTVFFFQLYPAHARSAFIGAIISVAVGLYFGDLITNFLYGDFPMDLYLRIYAAMLTMYIYLYLDVAFNCIKDFVQGKRAPIGPPG